MTETQTITTSEDFESQQYENGVRETVEEPSHTIDPTLQRLFRPDQPIVLKYDGVSVLARKFKGFPDATLSHYAVSRFLRNSGVRPESIADLGSGVAFNGIYASVHLNSERIIFADLYPEAMDHAVNAYQMNHGIDLATAEAQRHQFGARVNTGLHELDFRVGDARMTLRGERFDCAVAAPMFVPGVCEVWPQAYEVFSAVSKEAGAPIYFGHSGLALPEVNRAAQITGRKISTHELGTVPLRLEYADESHTSRMQKDTQRLAPHVEAELMNRGMIKRVADENPRYYHSLMVSVLE